MIAFFLGGVFFARIGYRKTQFIGQGMAIAGGFIILAVGLQHQDSFTFPIMVTFAKFGISLAFGINYTANSYLFPTLFAATAIGLCNSFARTFSALSPIFA